MQKVKVQVKWSHPTIRNTGCQNTPKTLKLSNNCKHQFCIYRPKMAIFFLECDLSAKHVGLVLYQLQNGNKHIIAWCCKHIFKFWTWTMWIEKMNHTFSISTKLKLHSINGPQCFEKNICSKKPTKVVCIQKFLEEISDFSFDIEYISGKHMFILSRFPSDNHDDEPIP